MRALSGSECTGFALSMSIARKRSGWSVRISSGITLHGISPVMMRCPPTGLRRSPPPFPPPPRLREARVDVHPALLAEVAREQVDELLEVGVQRAVRRLLDAEVFVDIETLDADAMRRADGAHIRLSATPAIAHVLCDRHRREMGAQLVETIGVLGEPVAVDQRSPPPAHASSAARHHASVPGRTCRWMSASSAVSLRRGSITINDRAGIVDDRLQHRAGAREAVRLPRVLAHEHRDLGVLEVAGRVAARPPEELTVDPELARLLLRERVRRVDDAESAARRAAIATTEMVGLAAAAVIEDRRTAVRVADRRRGARRSRRSPCPSRSSRRCRRRGVGAETSAGDGRSGSGRAATPSRTCSPQTSDGPCRRAPARSSGRRGAPRCRS